MHYEILYQCDPTLNIHCEHHRLCMMGFHDACFDTLDRSCAKRTRSGTPIVDFIYVADEEGHRAPLMPSKLTAKEKRMPKTPNYTMWLRAAKYTEQFENEEVRWEELNKEKENKK